MLAPMRLAAALLAVLVATVVPVPAARVAAAACGLGGDGAMAYEGFAATGAATGAPVPTSLAVTPATATHEGPGMSFIVHGSTPNATITLTIETAGHLPLAETVRADAYGTYSSYLGAA